MQKIKKKKNVCAKNWNGKGRSHDFNVKLSSWARAFTKLGHVFDCCLVEPLFW
jgi:hypothetical protein